MYNIPIFYIYYSSIHTSSRRLVETPGNWENLNAAEF